MIGGALLQRVGERRLRAWDPRLAWLLSERPVFREEGAWVVPEPGAIMADGFNPRRFRAVKPAGTFRIVCLGQSITEGFPFHPRGGYPEWLARYLGDLLPSRKIEVVNAGVSGADSTRDVSILEQVLRYEPDFVVLYEGNNEGVYVNARAVGERWTKVIAAIGGVRWMGRRRIDDPSFMRRYSRNVSRMLDAAGRRSVRVLLLGQVNFHGLDQPGEPGLQDGFLASRAGASVAFVDLRRAFKEAAARGRVLIPDLLLDEVHPSLEGHRLIAREVCRELERRGWVASAGEWRWGRLRPESAYRREMGLTEDFVARGILREVAFNAVWRDPRASSTVASMLHRARGYGLTPGQIRAAIEGDMPPGAPMPEILARELEAMSR